MGVGALCLSTPVARADPATEQLAVTIMRATSRCIVDRLAASGTFVARHAVELRADRDGLVVSEVDAEPGDVVAKDQVLARLVSPKSQQPVVLKAPVAGIVTAANAIVGAMTAAGADAPLFRIAEAGEVELKAQTLAASLPRLRPGMPAKLHVVGLGELDGRVAAIDDGLDARTQLVGLRLAAAPDPRLRIGTFARAEIEAGRDCGLTVPLSAVLFTTDGAVVATVQSGRVVMRSVSTGPIEGGEIEVRAGLRTDDIVVARAAPFLREGDRVRPVPDKP